MKRHKIKAFFNFLLKNDTNCDIIKMILMLGGVYYEYSIYK